MGKGRYILTRLLRDPGYDHNILLISITQVNDLILGGYVLDES